MFVPGVRYISPTINLCLFDFASIKILSNSPSILILKTVLSEKCMFSLIYKATPPLGLDLFQHTKL